VRKKHPRIEEEDPALFSRMCRNRIIGDHIVRKVDGGPDTEENIQSLCLDCNSDKTILAEDWRNKD
jgi:5-methylcytosine-specific restriction endonuclease McrA